VTAVEILIALLLIACAGFGAAALALPRGRTDVPEFVAVAILFGGAFVSLAMFLCGVVCADPLLRIAVSSCALLLGAIGFFKTRKTFAFEWPRFSGALCLTLLALVFAQTILVTWQSIAQTLRWDGVFAWEIKAHIAFLNGGRIPSAYFTDWSRAWSHPQYPFGLPMLEDWLYCWLGEPHQGLVKVLFPFVYIAAIALLFVAGKRITGDIRIALTAAALPFFVPCLIVGPGSASCGWADFPIATVYLAAVFYLVDYATNATRASLRLFSLCAALLPWTKQEGVILAGCLFLIGIFVALPRRELTPMLLAAIPLAIVVIGWKIFLAAMHAPPQSDFLPFTPDTFLENWDRIGFVAKFLAGEAIRWSRWGVLWLVMLVALCDLARRGRERHAVLLTATIALPVAIYSAVYIFSAWPNWRAHVSTSLPRLIMDVSLAAVLAIALALAPAKTGTHK